MFNCLSVQFQYNGEVQPKAFWENHSKIDFDCFVPPKENHSIHLLGYPSFNWDKKKRTTPAKKEKKSC
jgi:hypothetical protein